MSEILQKIDEFGESVLAMRKNSEKRFDELQSRIEIVEAFNERPRGKASQQQAAFKVFHTDTGPVYEVPSHVKVQDVLQEKQPEISYDRWLAAAMLGDRCNDKQALQYAREQKQMTTASTGVLVPTQFIGVWVDNLRSQMVLNSAGMTTVLMDGKKQTRSAVVTDPAVTWHSEAGSISAGNPVFALRELEAETLVARCQGSVELAQDCPNFGEQLSQVMARAMAAKLDAVGLIGTGTPPEPQGILGTSGINQVTSVGTLADYSKFITAVQKLLDSGVSLDVATKVAIMGPNTWARLENLPTGISSDKTQLPRPRALETTNFLVTSALAPSGSPLRATAFMGDFRDLLLGVRREVSVEAVKATDYVGKLVIDWVAYGRFDYVVVRPKSFCTLEGIVGT